MRRTAVATGRRIVGRAAVAVASAASSVVRAVMASWNVLGYRW